MGPDLFVPFIYVLSGCSLLSGVHHLFIALRSADKATHILFAAAAIAVTAVTLARAASLATDSSIDLVSFRRLEFIAVAMTFIALIWFFTRFAGLLASRSLHLLTSLWGLLIAIAIFLPYGIHFDAVPAQLVYRQLPWGEAVVDLGSYSNSNWLLAGWLVLVASIGFCFNTMFHRARKVGFGPTAPVIFALAAFSGLMLTHFAANLDLLPIIQTGDFAFAALILMMHYRIASYPGAKQREMYNILDHMPMAFSQKDIKGEYLFINHAFRSLVCEQYPVVLDDQSIFGEQLAAKFSATEQLILQNGTEADSEYTLECRGTIRKIRLLQFPVTDIDGMRSSLCSIHIDTTRERELEDKMQRMRLQLWRADRLSNSGTITKSLAHELSQPLTAILNNAQAALRFLEQGTMDPEELSQILNDIVHDDKRAGAVINNLHSMMQNQNIPCVVQPLEEILQETISFLRAELMNHAVDFRFVMAEPLVICVNRTQIQQVMINLIMNALEAMEGSSRSHVLRLTVVKQADTALVSLEDNGPGIPEDKLGAVFNGFFTTKPKGLGIGLELCRDIVTAHGGRIWASANSGPGVTINFTLPLGNEQLHTQAE